MNTHDLRHGFRAALLVATAFGAFGVGTFACLTPVYAASAPQPDINTRLSRLEADVQRLLKQNPAAASEVIPGSSTDMESRILTLERTIEQLTGQMEETRYKSDRSAEELKTLSDDVNLRLATIEQALGITPGAAPAPAAPPRPHAAAPAFQPGDAARAAAAANAAAATPDSPLSQPMNAPRPARPSESAATGAITESNVPPTNPLAGDSGSVDANGGFVVRTDANGRPLPADPNAAPPQQTARVEPPAPVPRAAPAAPSVTGNQLASLPPGDVALPNGSAKQQYDYAFDFLKRNDYSRGEAALRQFLQKNPKDPLAGNAQYWLGETFYVRGNYQQAAVEFMAGYQTYPKGGKGSDNLLKLGLSLEKLNQNDGACTAFGRVTKDYPDASEQVKAQVKAERAKLKCK